MQPFYKKNETKLKFNELLHAPLLKAIYRSRLFSSSKYKEFSHKIYSIWTNYFYRVIKIENNTYLKKFSGNLGWVCM